jgi:hypothetical protein
VAHIYEIHRPDGTVEKGPAVAYVVASDWYHVDCCPEEDGVNRNAVPAGGGFAWYEYFCDACGKLIENVVPIDGSRDPAPGTSA